MKNIIVYLILLIVSIDVAHAEYLGFDVDRDSFYSLESVSVISGLYVKHLYSTSFDDDGIERDYNESNDFIGMIF